VSRGCTEIRTGQVIMPPMVKPTIELPLTGAYYWIPVPREAGHGWDLTTCHDLGVWDGISHREFWPFVLNLISKRWGKDPESLSRRLRDHHTGLPRGRIVHPKTGFILIHGDDAPLANWLELVKARFRLSGVKVTLEFTEHEKMLGDDPRAVEVALDVSLHLKPPS
jgi:hypothetical protein